MCLHITVQVSVFSSACSSERALCAVYINPSSAPPHTSLYQTLYDNSTLIEAKIQASHALDIIKPTHR